MTIWFASDHHFFHENILKFKDENDNPVRPGFSSMEDMNETLVKNHNSVVEFSDTVFFLGDVTWRVDATQNIFSRLNGKKMLIVGNHDNPKSVDLTKWFDKVMLWRVFREHSLIATHLPLHESAFRHGTKFNLHGHCHSDPDISKNHLNVSVERTNYTPISLDDVLKRFKEKQ